jgi:putative mRNA 3-end processing factor
MAARGDTEAAFLDHITKVVEHGTGSVVIPVFALGRAQDVLLSLSKKKWSVPIYLDGMCVDVTKMVLKYDESYIRNRKILSEMFNRRIELVKKESTREKIMGNRGIFVTTSGMLQGGPILGYIENMWGNPNNAILLTGYQCKRTNGQLLQDEGYIYLHGWKTYVKCQVAKYGFSGHADDSQLRDLITKLNPKNLIIDHGDLENSTALKEWAEKNTQIKVFLPAIGEGMEF